MDLTRIKALSSTVISNAIGNYINTHRAELITAIRQAETDRARGILFAFCDEVPAAAGIITLLMKGTAEQAINNIALFDRELADGLRPYAKHVAQLQELLKAEPGAPAAQMRCSISWLLQIDFRADCLRCEK